MLACVDVDCRGTKASRGIEGKLSDARLFDADTGLALETRREGDVLTVTLAGAHGVLLSLLR